MIRIHLQPFHYAGETFDCGPHTLAPDPRCHLGIGIGIGTVAGLATAGIGAATAAGAFSGDGGGGPAPRDINAEIQAILDRGPELYLSQAALSPAYNALFLQNLQQMLWGTRPGSQPTFSPRWRNIYTGEVTDKKPDGSDGTNPGWWKPFQALQDTRGAYTAPDGTGGGTPGLVQEYAGLVGPSNALNTATRTATYNDIRGLSPELSALFDELTKSATLGLAAGSTLGPQERFQALGPSRANAAAGFAPGSQAQDLEQALAWFAGGQNLLNQRQQTASGVSELGNRLYTLPTLGFAASTSPGALLGSAAGSIPSSNVFNQLGGYAGDLFGSNQNAAYAQYISDQNNAAARDAALGGLFGRLGGSLLARASTGGTGRGGTGLDAQGASWGDYCWAAREIFGAEKLNQNSETQKWTVFRAWMLTQSHPSLFQWYGLHGAEWAARLKHASIGTRAAVRRWMERRIESIHPFIQ